jgi:hypothetical protein
MPVVHSNEETSPPERPLNPELNDHEEEEGVDRLLATDELSTVFDEIQRIRSDALSSGVSDEERRDRAAAMLMCSLWVIGCDY